MKSMQVGTTTVHYHHTGRPGGIPLVFLQGFGIAPRFYTPIFDRLGQHFEIFAPDLLRSRVSGGRPASIRGCASLIDDFCRAMGLNDYAVVGHSMGGAAASLLAANSDGPRRVVGLNPVLPVGFGRAGFVRRSVIKSLREATGREGWSGVRFAGRFHGGFMRDVLGDLSGTTAFMEEALRFEYDGLNIQQPALILFSDRDEYFALDARAEANLRGAFESLTIERVPNLGHDWLIFHPNRAAQAIRGFAAQP